MVLALSPMRLLEWLLNQPPRIAVMAGAAAIVVSIGAFFGTYRLYDYVQHDNDFCWSCHLMRDPFLAFEASVHSGLGCKACHQPTTIERATMGLVAVIDRPEEITHHADVPNDLCASCHIDGDPEEWVLVAASAGHQAHLDPFNRELEDVRCVQCHSSGVHNFGSTAESCGQAGCHEEVKVVLQGMERLPMNCTSCHFFERVVGSPERLVQAYGGHDEGHAGEGESGEDEADGHASPVRAVALEDAPEPPSRRDRVQMALLQGDLLTPEYEQCTDCHAMRDRLELDPLFEPHQGVCGACHNPHTDHTAQDASRSCATAGCHERADTLDVDHHQWVGVDLDNCTTCHRAHVFSADERQCGACHTDGFDRSRALNPAEAGAALWRRAVALPPPTAEELRAAPNERAGERTGGPARPDTASGGAEPPDVPWTGHGGGDVAVDLRWAHEPIRSGPSPGVHQVPSRPPPADTTGFVHGDHRSLSCLVCHEGGTPQFASDPRWCDGCHHAPEANRSCQACHRPSAIEVAPRPVQMNLPGGPVTRELDFPHQEHAAQGCQQCHRMPPSAGVEEPDCASCHQEHHGPTADCSRCHGTVPQWPHDPALVHSGCTGSLCHSDVPGLGLETGVGVDSVGDPGAGGTDPAWWRRNVCAACHAPGEISDPIPSPPSYLKIPVWNPGSGR